MDAQYVMIIFSKLNTDAGCIPACLNNGECVRGQCRCKSGFEGKYCEVGKGF